LIANFFDDLRGASNPSNQTIITINFTKIIFMKNANYYCKKLSSNLLFFGLLLLGSTLNAQKIDLSLQFNANNSTYEVYAKPNFTKGEFLMGAGSQVTVLIPADFEDKSLITNNTADNRWVDQSPVYAPSEMPESDLHTFVLQGGTFDFKAGESTQLFSFANDLSLTDFYESNYAINKEIKGHVKDWRGYPIEGVKITAGNKSFTSLYDGRFEFMEVLVNETTEFNLQQSIAAKTGIREYENVGWRFLPTDWLKNTADYQRVIPTTIPKLVAERIYSVDFTAIKIGDVNGSYTVNPKVPTNIPPSPKTLTINLLNTDLKAGQNYVVPFSTNDFALLSAYQLTLKIENANINKLANTFKKQPGLALKELPKGLIVANWLNDKTVKKVLAKNSNKQNSHQAETAILELEIIPQKDGLLSDFITILDEPVRTEAYDTDGKVMPLQLLFRRAPEEEGTLEVYQNIPNPFRETTDISYFLPKNGPVTLTITDEAGQVLKVLKETAQKGFNAFTIAGSEMPKGLIYYKLETDFGTETKKMLHLN